MASRVYRFGPFSIDSDARLLFRNGERVPLPPKAADLLVALVEREGQLVSKDELLKVVWPDTFVEEGNLARHVFLLRKLLGESAGGSSYVETVPKRGYRFVGSVDPKPLNLITTTEEHTSEHIVIEEGDGAEAPVKRPRRRMVAVVGLLLSAAMVVGWIVWSRASTAKPLRSLLVLPFANLSRDAGSEYYSDGLTDELIAAFSGVRGLRVVPRTTAFQFKGKSGDVRGIGRQLEAEAVLDGGVQRDADRLRIRLSLTRVSDGQTIWSQTYDRRTRDVFSTQNEIAANVIRAVLPTREPPLSVPPPSGTRNLEAQNLYLKANFVRQKFFGSSINDALALFRKAAELDRSYAQAWAGQAFCYSELGYGYLRYPKDVFPLAVQAIDRALALNPRLALAHAIRETTILSTCGIGTQPNANYSKRLSWTRMTGRATTGCLTTG